MTSLQKVSTQLIALTPCGPPVGFVRHPLSRRQGPADGSKLGFKAAVPARLIARAAGEFQVGLFSSLLPEVALGQVHCAAPCVLFPNCFLQVDGGVLMSFD